MFRTWWGLNGAERAMSDHKDFKNRERRGKYWDEIEFFSFENCICTQRGDPAASSSPLSQQWTGTRWVHHIVPGNSELRAKGPPCTLRSRKSLSSDKEEWVVIPCLGFPRDVLSAFYPLCQILPCLPSRLALLYLSILSCCCLRLTYALSSLLSLSAFPRWSYPSLPTVSTTTCIHRLLNCMSKIQTSHSDCKPMYSSTLDISLWSGKPQTQRVQDGIHLFLTDLFSFHCSPVERIEPLSIYSHGSET